MRNEAQVRYELIDLIPKKANKPDGIGKRHGTQQSVNGAVKSICDIAVKVHEADAALSSLRTLISHP